jgi:RNA polymerase sigma factor FliA
MTKPASRPFVETTSSARSEPAAGEVRVAVEAYGRQVRQVRQDALVLEHLPLVHRIVSQVVSYLHPPLNREDLVSAGTLGLIQAARDYDPACGAEFGTYAYMRVRGAVIDELRRWSFAPARLKKQLDRAQALVREAIEQTGRPPSDEELAAAMDLRPRQLYRLFEQARARHFLSLHGLDEETPALGAALAAPTHPPAGQVEQQELRTALAAAIGGLPDRQRQIVLLYYTRELTMRQIAAVLGVTESRVSQLHAAALFSLSVRLRDWDTRRETSPHGEAVGVGKDRP